MRFLLLVCTAILVAAMPARAQDAMAPPAHISFVEGAAFIEHDGESEAAALDMVVLEGDHVRTENGRVEVMFPDGAAVGVDPYSEIELQSGMRVRVLAGGIQHIPAPAVDPGSASTQYLPRDLQMYGSSFDQYGSWQYESPYGYVWYPTVAADWRPYYYGYWSPVRRYGLTWVGFNRWSWPTHHYGRWGYAHSRWYWIPGRTWSTAWVSWGTAPDYVSWCPLGYDGRPVGALSVGYHSAWNAWTVVPRARFATGRYAAHRYAVEPYRLASTTPFVMHRNPPATIPGRVMGVGPARTDTGNASVGVAVPRYGDRQTPGSGYRSPRGDNADRDRPVVVTPGGPSRDDVVTLPGRRDPSWERRPGDGRRTTNDQQPTTTVPRPTTNDHPAYRPNYAPTYDPPAHYRQPHAAGPSQGGAADRGPAYQRPQQSGGNDGARQGAGDASGRAERRGQPREVAPSAPPQRPAPSAAPSNAPAPSGGVRGPQSNGGAQRDGGGQRDSGPSHARTPHADSGGQSQGTAVRRPR